MITLDLICLSRNGLADLIGLEMVSLELVSPNMAARHQFKKTKAFTQVDCLLPRLCYF